MQSDTELFADAVLSTVAASGTIVVDAMPQVGAETLRVAVSCSEMLALLAKVRPRIIYLYQQYFDIESEIEEISENLRSESSDDYDVSPISALKKSAKIHDGSLCIVYSAFCADSVLHYCFEKEEWYESFEFQSEEVADRLGTVLSENKFNSTLASSREISQKATVLEKDSAFNFKPSREKRIFLAEKLFPECDSSEIYRIVDEAINIGWLNQARSGD